MLRRRFMLGDSIPKYPYTITVGYYASEEIPFLGGYKYTPEMEVITPDNSKHRCKFSLLQSTYDATIGYGEYTIISEWDALGFIGQVSQSDNYPVSAYLGGLFGGMYQNDAGAYCVYDVSDKISAVILDGQIRTLHAAWDGLTLEAPNYDVTLPDSIQYLGEDSLVIDVPTITIPKSVQYMDKCLACPDPNTPDTAYWFSCLNLKPCTPPSIVGTSKSIFNFGSGEIRPDFKIRVYPHVVDTYKKNEQWKQYSQYIDTINNSVVSTNYIPATAFTSNGNSVTQTNRIQDGYTIYEYSGELTEVIDGGFNGAYISVIYLPNSITKIGKDAFYNSDCQEITLGKGIIDIGRDAFNKRYDEPDTFKVNYLGNIQDWCNINFTNQLSNPLARSSNSKFFIQGELLTDLVIPEGVSTFNERAFYDLKQLSSVTFPTTFTGVNITHTYDGFVVFNNAVNIESITWNAKNCSDFTWSKPLFKNVTNLKSFTIGDEVEYLPQGILNSLNQITLNSLTVPSNVKKVGKPFNFMRIDTLLWNPEECECVETDYDNFSANNIIFSDNVKCIPNSFQKNVIKSITIGENVEKIKQPFTNMSSLEKISVPDLSKWCKIIHVTGSLGDSNNQHDLYVKDQKIIDLIIPEDVTYIKNNQFANTNITSVKIPNVKHIGSRAFYDCPIQTIECNANLQTSALISYNSLFAFSPVQSVIFQDNVQFIPEKFLSDCGQLTDVLLSSSIKKIGNSAFQYCRALSNITIPDSVEYIGKNAFFNTPVLDAFPNGLVYLGKNLYTYKGVLPEEESITLNEDTISISEACFFDQSNLSEILLPNSVKILGSYCFEGTNLNTLSIPESVEEIGEDIVIDTPLYDNTENWENGCLYIDNCLLSINWDTFSGTELILKDTTRIMADNLISVTSNITKIITNEGLTYLGRLALLSPVQELFISKTVNKINEILILPNSDTSLKITVDSDNTVYDSRGCNAVVETASNTMLYGYNIDRVPDTIEYINVLLNPTTQQSLYIPINVKYIGITNALEIIYEGTFEQFRGICNSNMINESVIIKCSDGDFTLH